MAEEQALFPCDLNRNKVLDFKSMSKEGWGKSLTGFCGVTDKCVVQYFKTTNNTMKGKQFFLEGYVQRVIFHASPFPEDVGISAIQARCLPSMKKGSYPVKIAFNSNGMIAAATCECPTGLAALCHHIAAVLYYLEAITSIKLTTLPDDKASTETLCKWIQPPAGNVSGKPLADLGFPKTKKKSPNPEVQSGPLKIQKLPSNLYDPRAPRHRNTDQSGLNLLFETLTSVNPTCAFASHFKNKYHIDNSHTNNENCQNQPNISNIRNVNSPSRCKKSAVNDFNLEIDAPSSIGNITGSSLFCTDFQKKVQMFIETKYPKLTNDETLAIEQKTIGQSNNKDWFIIRSEKLTASNFGPISKLTVQPENLLKKLLYQKIFFSKATTHGLNNEDMARQAYVQYKLKRNSHVTVKDCGIFVMADKPFLAGSPDGLVKDLQSEGLLEIKCPYSKFGEPISTSLNDKKFYLKSDATGKISLKKNHNYFFQVQGCLAITGLQWCDFFVWNGCDLDQQYCERIIFDKYFWENNMLPSIMHFFKYAFVPELLLERVKNKKDLYGAEKYTPYKIFVKAKQSTF